MRAEQRPALSIAPTNSGTHDGPQISGPAGVDRLHTKPRLTGLTVSKQWVLPPRPKPGRKPKPKPAKVQKAVQSSQTSKASPQNIKSNTEQQRRHSSHNQVQYINPTSNQLQTLHSPNNSPNGVNSPTAMNSPAGITSPISTNSSTGIGSFDGMNSPKSMPSKPNSHDDDDDNCGLCSKEDCMCETIGFKQATIPPERRQRLPSLDTILNSSTIRMDAVPLKRAAAPLSISRPTKFSRFSDFAPMHPAPAFSVPSPLDGLGDGCGFCTENTPCACAEASKASFKETELVKSSSTTTKDNFSINDNYTAKDGMLGKDSYSHNDSNVSKDGYLNQDLYEVKEELVMKEEDVFSCGTCEKDAMSMLFCLSLTSAKVLTQGAVSIPCHLASRTLQKHPKFEGCDLGRLVRQLEVNGKQVGVQSINRVLQDLDRGVY